MHQTELVTVRKNFAVTKYTMVVVDLRIVAIVVQVFPTAADHLLELQLAPMESLRIISWMHDPDPFMFTEKAADWFCHTYPDDKW